MWNETYNVTSIQEAVYILTQQGEKARIVAGATDLILEMERGVRKGITTLVDITRIPDLDRIGLDENGLIHLGPLVTHNQCVASKLIQEKAFPLAQAAWEVGAPQIRNRGTVAGNLITASPANDTITPLMALGARLTLRSLVGERQVSLKDFYRGVRQTVMRPDEMLVDISFPAMNGNEIGTFIKLGLRRAQAISVVNVAIALRFLEVVNGNVSELIMEKARITLGSVAPIIIHAEEAEMYLAGRRLDEETIETAARLTEKIATPIDDVRASKDYRREMVRVCTLRALRAISSGAWRAGFPPQPVLLMGQVNRRKNKGNSNQIYHDGNVPIVTKINGKEYSFMVGQGKTLLRLLREEAGLTGTKEGCAEGECGACTVFLDSVAVMSCLVPATRADGAEIVTIEGLADNGKLHPVQQAFIEEGAVQCGYCTPGFIMSAAKLLEEKPHPAREDIEQAITGNLCRCTGYIKILNAIERASKMETPYE